MHHRASPAAPARRLRWILLAGLAILGVTIAAFVELPSLASAPTSPAADVDRSTQIQPPPDEADRGDPGRVAHEADGAIPDGVVDVADGVIPDGVTASVFDEEIPAVGRLDPTLLDALRRAAKDAGADGVGLRINSGWRSPEYQQQLVQDAVAQYGSREEAARWVATAETSAHVSGDAVDIGALGPLDATAWLSEHGAAHGLCQIYGNEPWHYELRPAAVDDGCPPMYADPTEDPRMQP